MSYLFEDSEWNMDLLHQMAAECEKIATDELGLDTYPNEFQIVSSEQMLDAYSSVGMPINYKHWSFGKQYIRDERSYKSGMSGLAMELVINSSPCINYLMDDNTAFVQFLVIAHAASGHNHFFKNNYLFKDWTDADSIIEYLNFARNYISKCEEKYGKKEVEEILDSCHALRDQGVDKYKRPPKMNKEMIESLRKQREEDDRKSVNILWDTLTSKEQKEESSRFPESPEENILKFIEKNSPVLESWQREIVRIVRMISQFFAPQRITRTMNEGFACWTHDYIVKSAYDKGLINDGSMLEYAHVNSSVLYQPGFNSKHYSGINPYALGFTMFKDIERICKDPTDEDKEWFPDIAGKHYITVIKDIVENYRDESFIRQFLSPKVIRDMRLFTIHDKDPDFYTVSNIHNEQGYKDIRNKLANQYEMINYYPDIHVYDANIHTDRSLELHHHSYKGKLLDKDNALECLKHVKRLWGFEPFIITFDENGDHVDEFLLSEKND